jgi:hypothetical protein
MKSGNLNFLEPSGPLQACNWTAVPFSFYIHKKKGMPHLKKAEDSNLITLWVIFRVTNISTAVRPLMFSFKYGAG